MALEGYLQTLTGETLAAARLADDPRVRTLEATVRRRDAVLGAICYAASRFLATADWDRDIKQVLARLGTAAEVSRVYLFEGRHDEEGTFSVSMQEEWLADGVDPLSKETARQNVDIDSHGLARWDVLDRGDVIHGPLRSMPEAERAYFGVYGVRSLAAVPVFAGDRWWGYLGFTDDVTEREWSSSVLEVLQAAAATLGAAIYRREAEETLRESEERFRRLSESAFEGVFIHDNGVVLEGNPAVARIFGYELDELIGKNVFDLITPEARTLVEERIRSGWQEPYEITARRKDGSIVIGEITGRPAMYLGRRVRVATINDITERRENEARLEAQTEQLAEAQAIARVGSWVWEIETNELRGSDSMYNVYGFTPDATLTPNAILQRVHPDDADLVRQTIDRTVNDGASFSVDHRLMRTPTDVRWLHVEGRVVRDRAGHPMRIIGAGQDITDRREAEVTARRLSEEQAARELAESAERRSAFLAEASRLLGSSFDYHTTLATLSRLAVPALADFCTLDLLQRDGSYERVGVAHIDPTKEQMLWDLTRLVKAGATLAPHLRRAFGGEATLIPEFGDGELEAIATNDEHLRIIRAIAPRSLVCVPLLMTGRVVGAFVLYASESGRHFDDDDLSLAEELAGRAALAVENARLFDEAERATRARDQMLGVVAHDLRNPLSTILMASQLLTETLEAESAAFRQVALMRRAGERMNRLIQDLLDVKRIENGRLMVEPRPVPALSLLTEAAEALRPLAAASKLELLLDTTTGDLPQVNADPNRVQQVLSNLIGNAIKFTPRGGHISMRGEHLANEVRLAVIDSGPGIPAEQLPHVFGQYWQGSRADRRGIGLGLAIAKGIVEGHNGRIWVESTVGEGSSFYFTLPVVDAEASVRA